MENITKLVRANKFTLDTAPLLSCFSCFKDLVYTGLHSLHISKSSAFTTSSHVQGGALAIGNSILQYIQYTLPILDAWNERSLQFAWFTSSLPDAFCEVLYYVGEDAISDAFCKSWDFLGFFSHKYCFTEFYHIFTILSLVLCFTNIVRWNL